jgi:hypothetical protein
MFVKNEKINLNFNFTFDYPFPVAGENDTLIIAEVWRAGNKLESKAVSLRKFLEKYNIVSNGKYAFQPIYFNFSANVEGKNVSYTPVKFTYSVNQQRRAPYEGEDDKKWTVSGRIIQDPGDGTYIYSNYCSGPWDFSGESGGTGIGNYCYRQSGSVECRKGGELANECKDNAGNGCQLCCSGMFVMKNTTTALCTRSGLNGDCYCATLLENPAGDCQDNDVLGTQHWYCDMRRGSLDTTLTIPSPYYRGETGSDCCIEQSELGFRCNTSTYGMGACLRNSEKSLQIFKGAWDEYSGQTSWTASVQKGAILYVEVGDSRNVPNEPAVTPNIPNIKWASAHSWKFVTYVNPTQKLTQKMLKVYPDDGMRFFYYYLSGNNWKTVGQNWSCATGLFDYALKADTLKPSSIAGIGCPIHISLDQNEWYKLEFYLYNDPFGVGESGGTTPWNPVTGENPLGLRIQDSQSNSLSLLDILGTDSFVSSEPPGDDNVNIDGSATVYANEGLKEIRDFKKFATSHPSAGCVGDVDCEMRVACGNSDYEGVKTNKYGWILNHVIYPSEWSDVGGVSTTKAGYITSNGRNSGKTLIVDTDSILGERWRYTDLWFGYGKSQRIGGIYRCLKDWPSWATDCPTLSDQYTYTRGSDQMKCCYVAPKITGQKVTIEYYSGYQYIINFLPGAGDKLCAASTANVGDAADTSVIYQSNYTNQFCDTKTGNRCCYCRPEWGCRMDCVNELNMTASSKFTLPFPTIGPFWEFKNLNLRLCRNFEDGRCLDNRIDYVINLSSQGNEKDGWDIRVKLGDKASLILDKNYTIPFSILSDFGLKAPEETGAGRPDTLRLILNTTVAASTIPGAWCRFENSNRRMVCDYNFYTADCTKEGEKGSYYDETTYPSTKGKGVCKPGTRTCTKVADNYLKWAYDSKYDMPVYPSQEICNGKDDDCNGIVDDVMPFSDVIDEIVFNGGKKTPYQVTECGCFMGASAAPEKCDGIDNDCNGAVDDASAKIWANTCDPSVQQCLKEGSPYEWCKKLYDSTQCSLRLTAVAATGNVTVNTCTQRVRECMNNMHIPLIGNQVNFTYEECKNSYNNYSCFFGEKTFIVLGDMCRCTLSNPQNEACNGVDDDCDGIVDNIENPVTCGCAFLSNATAIAGLKGKGDASCDGIDSDCNGAVDDGANNCACTGRSAKEVVDIKSNVKEICDGVDNDCNGLVDENFPQVGKACGYGQCSGGTYVCGVHGDQVVCNTTVNPDETFSGKAIKLSYSEACDLKDNDCDYSIDEDCACTPESSVKLCGYQSGVYYKNKQQLTQTCGQVMNDLRKLITWAEAPENVKYRRLITIRNNDNVMLNNYPINLTLNTRAMSQQGRLRPDGGDLRIIPAGSDTHVVWGNSSRFNDPQTIVWFKTTLAPNEEKKFYMYYGNPSATYVPVGVSTVTGLDYGRGVFLLCHFDGTTACEGNMVPRYDNGVTFDANPRELFGEMINAQGAYIDGFDRLSYATSENFNKNRGTIMMWFSPTDLTEDHALFYSNDLSGKPQFSLYFNESGTYFRAYDKSGMAREVNGGIINIGIWHHIAVTWDNLKGISMYIDGGLKGSVKATWEANDIGMDVYIGSNSTSGNTAYSLIDELAVYSQELDQASVKEKMRAYMPYAKIGNEETFNETISTSEAGVYEKCAMMLENISTDEAKKATILSLCDSVRICNKTEFPINEISECTFGTQTCASGEWSACTAVMPKAEICNQKDDDCNGKIDDVAVPETCACANGGKPGIETCNGVDDDCNGIVDDVKKGNSLEATHCGCFGQIVNITQRRGEKETLCNGIDDNCNGVIDEGLDKCACVGTVFNAYNNTWAGAIMAEKCDDVDNDCNAKIDDPWVQGGSAANKFEYLGASCSPLNSRCVGGMFVCSKDANGIVCSTTSGDGIKGQDMRANETCNMLDDDCNGKIDDIWGGVSGKFCRCYNGVPRVNETCNGIDDDCNGLIDDGMNNCGCSFDLEDNVNNINQLSVLISNKKAGGETCNNIDDDCNGLVDDGLGDKCFCSGGFGGNAATKPEFCNGVDDDCNGVTDDVTHPETCACYNDTKKQGQQSEICNSIDDDCNGLIDEDWPMLGSMCGLGACSSGVYECSGDAKGAVCSTMPGGSQDKSKNEECGNNIDDNCNGVIDESCVCNVTGETRSCSLSVGECKEGVQTCTASGWSGCIGGVLPTPEICDGKDNDCNGVIDDVTGGNCGCYNGGTPTTEVCNSIDDDCNGVVDDVNGKSSVEATQCGCYKNAYAKGAKPEACNRIDDDCDGIVDNVKGGDSVESTRCSCYNNALPGVESCNKIDDDCDGATDEDWATLSQECGQGICTGTFVCSPDGKNVVCDGRLPETEICDGKDNNCNGKVDEGCLGKEVGSCENSVQDSNEEGIDCGGTCPNACSPTPVTPGTGSWMLVFAALVVVIVAVGIVLVFLKPAAPV